MLIGKGADVNKASRCSWRYTPLIAAALTRHTFNKFDLIRLLFDEGKADPNFTDVEGMTPLHRVAYAGIPDVASLLIEYGADIDRVDLYGNTPRQAAEMYLYQAELHGFDLDGFDKEGWLAEFGPTEEK